MDRREFLERLGEKLDKVIEMNEEEMQKTFNELYRRYEETDDPKEELKLHLQMKQMQNMVKLERKYVKRKQDKHVKEQKKGRLSDYYDR